jgi:hypothetical protein
MESEEEDEDFMFMGNENPEVPPLKFQIKAIFEV